MALFDHSAETYDDWCDTPLGSLVDALEKRMMLEASSPKPGEKALDLGCGTGIYSLLLSRLGVEVTGIDISAAMLRKAREKAEKYNPSIPFIEGDVHQLPFADHTFDLVISNILLEFVDHPQKAVMEAMRVLKPEGRFVAGMIGKHSEWASQYQKQGVENKQSVFSSARFFSIQDIMELYRDKPSLMQLGLYVSPQDFVSREQADALEKERCVGQQEAGAGFIVAKWIKK